MFKNIQFGDIEVDDDHPINKTQWSNQVEEIYNLFTQGLKFHTYLQFCVKKRGEKSFVEFLNMAEDLRTNLLIDSDEYKLILQETVKLTSFSYYAGEGYSNNRRENHILEELNERVVGYYILGVDIARENNVEPSKLSLVDFFRADIKEEWMANKDLFQTRVEMIFFNYA